MALACRLGKADVNQETAQPGIDPARIAEILDVPPRDHQCVLDGILGSLGVAKNPMRDRVEPVGASTDHVRECLPIPVLCRLHEVPIHFIASSVRPVGAFNHHGRVGERDVHSSSTLKGERC
jgi:hypothetical protein